MIVVERQIDARRANIILNDSGVRPWIADASGVVDISPQVENRANILLLAEHGGIFFFCLQPGIYEAHTFVLPSARGAWTRALTEACARWMFTKTDAFEIVTRIPAGHVAAQSAALNQGMRYEFTRPKECRFRGELVDVHIHSFRVQDWMAVAPEIEETGRWFHDRLHAEATRLGITEPPHANDENHNRYLGACWEMAMAGQLVKATLLYNRWAAVSRHATIALLSTDPPTIRMDIGLLTIKGNDFEVSREC